MQKLIAPDPMALELASELATRGVHIPSQAIQSFPCQECTLMRWGFGFTHENMPPLASTSTIREDLPNILKMIHSEDGMMDCYL